MKKRMLLLGLGLAVVGTGLIVNKLRKRNNEVEETVEVNEEETTTVETVEENNEVEEMVNMVNEMSKEEVENMVENIMENKAENEICADEEPKMNIMEKAKIYIDEQISKINMSKETKMNLVTIAASVIIAALIMRFGHYMIKGAMFIGLVVVIKDTIDKIDINLGEVK